MTCAPVSYTHLRAHETSLHLVCRLLLENAADPRLGILNIVHRVVTGLGLGQIQVEVHMLFGFPQGIKKAGCISTDFLT